MPKSAIFSDLPENMDETTLKKELSEIFNGLRRETKIEILEMLLDERATVRG